MYFKALLELLSSERCASQNLESHENFKCTGLSYDSRNVKKGDIYFSIPGNKEDGSKFIQDAVLKGASLIIVPEGYHAEGLVPYIPVKDVRKALAITANAFYDHPSSKLRMVAVTGTNGKTSTCWILSKILSHISGPTIYLGTLGTVLMREGTEEHLSPEIQTTRDPIFNNQMLSEAVESGCLNAVMEVTSHGLSQNRTHGLNWDVCSFTNLTQDHLDYHKDMLSYGREKKKLFFEELVSSTKSNKFAVVNFDDSLGKEIFSELDETIFTNLSYSRENGSADLNLQKVDLNTFTSTLHLQLKNELFDFTSPLLGAFNYENLLCSIGVLLSLGYTSGEISKWGKFVESVPGRIELVSKSLPRVFVDYAHTPDALDKIQDVLKEMLKIGEKLITVFGCGGDRDSKKRPLMGRSVLERSDIGVVTSDNPRTEDPQAIIEDILKGIVDEVNERSNFQLIEEIDRKEAIRIAIKHANKNDIVLIAGKGHEDYQILGTEKRFFCDRTFAMEFLDERNR